MGFFSSVGKAIGGVFKGAKKVAKALAPFAGAMIGNAIMPGIGGTLIGGFIGGKIAGQSTKSALLGSVGSLVGGRLLGIAGKFGGGLPGMAGGFAGSAVAKSLLGGGIKQPGQPGDISSKIGNIQPGSAAMDDPRVSEARRRARRQASLIGRQSNIFAGDRALEPASVTSKTLLGA